MATKLNSTTPSRIPDLNNELQEKSLPPTSKKIYKRKLERYHPIWGLIYTDL